jgi:hypothetical protein
VRTMYDSIESTVLDLPDGADLYAGYDDGNWPDAAAIAVRFPGLPGRGERGRHADTGSRMGRAS